MTHAAPPPTSTTENDPRSVSTSRVGIVAIGRNEGERLRRCLQSLPEGVGGRVYVDSGSSDGSLALARSLGVEVVELDLSVPFTAARARNAGIEALREASPRLVFVHVLDGDCVMEPGWLEIALREMARSPDIAVVCGRRRERNPDATIYNRLCDLDWEATPGDARSCGGDALIRLAAFDQAGGYDPELIAGEEPEMCFRMRQQGWRIRQLVDTMTWHDAAMTRFGQWWKRCVRAGYAAAEGAWMHGRSPERYNVRRCASIVLWSLLLPILTIIAGLAWFPWGFALLLLYPIQFLRLLRRELGRRPARVALLHAAHLIVDKFAQLQGTLTFLLRRIRGSRSALIEYKSRNAQPQGGAATR